MTREEELKAGLVPTNSSSLSRRNSAALAQRGLQDVFAAQQGERCFREGYELVQQQDYQAAVECFLCGLNISPLHVGIRVLLADIYAHLCPELRDYKKAFEHFSVAADQGNEEAEIAIAFMYLNGEGVAKDPQKAFLWMDKAARHGQCLCQWWLGLMYEHGTGIEPDHREALFWYRQAAAQGIHAPSSTMTDLQKRATGLIEDDLSDTANSTVKLEADGRVGSFEELLKLDPKETKSIEVLPKK